MSEINSIPLLPLRDVVVYPHMVIPLFVGREKSIKALEAAMVEDKQIFLLAQKDATKEDPVTADLFEVGTIATILQLLKLPDGTVKILVEGNQRARLVELEQVPDYFMVKVELITESATGGKEVQALERTLTSQFEQYLKLNRKIPPEVLTSLATIDNPGRLADTIVAHMPVQIDRKQQVLEQLEIVKRLKLALEVVSIEIESMQVEKRLQKRVETQMKKSQHRYYLDERMKAIQEELDKLEGGGSSGSELQQLQEKIEKAGMPAEAKEKALAELKKLKSMSIMSAEATVSRNYLDWLLDVPWKEQTKINKDLGKAETILNADHYGLEKIKERIVEFLAVQQRVKKAKGPILCLVGPPGVGKTSLGQSIANATGRQFVRISLGGVRDEAEIRGHRRTYIGSMPGKIIQKLAKVKVRNPLFMLDEVDKMAMDFRGDPASALLEVLDPEQNSTFNDHYLEVDYDLSDVMFIATANSLNIPAPLLDRMEVIRLPGYTEEEKLNIATHYLVPKQLKESGLKAKEIEITDEALLDIVRYYTREAGVRSLERAVSKVARKVVREILLNATKKKIVVASNNLEKYLGVRPYHYGLAEADDQVGQVNGLAWTEVGGELLKIESTVMPGKGKLIYTGHLGDVMQESIQAALSVVRSRSQRLGIMDEFFHDHDIHVHLPEGATPKDGPSAGIGICTALVSAITKIPVKADVAMTGEITLRGEVLPIGGLKEKLLAALRAGAKTVIIPEENRKDLKEMPANITKNLTIRPVRWIDEVLQIALQHVPEPIAEKKVKTALIAAKQKMRSKKKTGRVGAH